MKPNQLTIEKFCDYLSADFLLCTNKEAKELANVMQSIMYGQFFEKELLWAAPRGFDGAIKELTRRKMISK